MTKDYSKFKGKFFDNLNDRSNSAEVAMGLVFKKDGEYLVTVSDGKILITAIKTDKGEEE